MERTTQALVLSMMHKMPYTMGARYCHSVIVRAIVNYYDHNLVNARNSLRNASKYQRQRFGFVETRYLNDQLYG